MTTPEEQRKYKELHSALNRLLIGYPAGVCCAVMLEFACRTALIGSIENRAAFVEIAGVYFSQVESSEWWKEFQRQFLKDAPGTKLLNDDPAKEWA